MLCTIVHDHRTASPEFFLCLCTWRLLTWLAHAPKKCTQSGNLQFDINSVQLKILSTRKLKTFFSMLNYLVLLLIAILHGRNTFQIYVQFANSRLSLLRRIKPFLNHHCALRFYNSCIHNLFIYCSSAWGNCSNYLLSRLLLLQKRAARLLLDAYFSQPSVSLFSKLKWLPIFDLIKLRKLVLLFTILNNPDAPLCLKRKFNFLSSVRSTGLRTRACASNLQVPYTLSLILESAHLLTLLPLFLIALTLILSK